MKKKMTRIFKLLFLILITFAFFEIGVRAFIAIKYPEWYGKWNIVKQARKGYRPFRIFGVDHYVDKNGQLYISSRHKELYPFLKNKNTYRIVCLGGSTTENSNAVNRIGKHYPLLLQERLRKTLKHNDIEVINVGNSSYTTIHSLILLELDIISWKPDLVILSHNYNDLATGYWDKEFKVDYSHKFLYYFYNPLERITFFNLLFQNSALYGTLWHKFSRFRVGPKHIKQKSRGNKPSQISIDIFRRNLHSFITIAKANGIDVILGNQPIYPDRDTFLKFAPRLPYNKIITWPLFAEFVNHHRYFNKILSDVARESNVWYVDNDSFLNHEKNLFTDILHYTPEGVRKLAAHYTDFIIKNNLIKQITSLKRSIRQSSNSIST
jgi:lysophospholipase L1-like esterase